MRISAYENGLSDAVTCVSPIIWNLNHRYFTAPGKATARGATTVQTKNTYNVVAGFAPPIAPQQQQFIANASEPQAVHCFAQKPQVLSLPCTAKDIAIPVILRERSELKNLLLTTQILRSLIQSRL